MGTDLHNVSVSKSSSLNPEDLKLDSLPIPFSSDPMLYAPARVPSAEEWKKLDEFWDLLTRYMIPGSSLPEKPINLRNPFGFYIGHIPIQTDIFLRKAIDSQASCTPTYFHRIFERGIDPDIKTGEIHPHSDYPEHDPPPHERVLAKQTDIRGGIRSKYKDGLFVGAPKEEEALWLGFEHEAMHLETLLYMHLMSESGNLRPPPGSKPDFEAIAKKAEAIATPDWDQQWINVPACSFEVGLDNPGETGFFGLDNEIPKRKVEVPAFQVMPRPLTNSDYARFLESGARRELPATWIAKDTVQPMHGRAYDCGHLRGCDDSDQRKPDFRDGKFIKTPYGSVPLKHALHWPVAASYEDLKACAEWFGGRVPTAEEVQAIYSYVDAEKRKDGNLSILTRRISGVNGHLSNGGVEISPPSHPEPAGASGVKKAPDSGKVFVDLDGCNVGFKHWHPTPVTSEGGRLLGRGETGGVWEWTSTVFQKHEGFEPLWLYPEYSQDFFKGEHNIVLGGSWATHPRIAGRKSFINFFQRDYQFAWCGARVVLDPSK